jgi:ketosteroid isomerase-like protein
MRMRVGCTGVLVLSLLGAAAPAGPAAGAAEPAVPLAETIAALNRQVSAAYARGDAEAIAALHTPDAKLLPPDGEIVRGREKIAEFWRKMMQSGVPELLLEGGEVGGGPTEAHEVGRYRLGGKSGRPVGRGKYVVIWKREGSSWLRHRHIWNATPSAPETEPPR